MSNASKSSGASSSLTRVVTVANKLGIHARPAAQFVKVASRFASEIFVERDGERVNGKSIMGLMMLAAGQGTRLTLIAEGNDAAPALEEIEALLRGKFGED